jgi:hypothetical protein
MADGQQPDEQKTRRIILDPSRFTISDDGQEVIMIDAELADALSVANENASDHGVGITITFG